MQFTRNLSIVLGLFLGLSFSEVDAQVVRYSVDGGPTVEAELPVYNHPANPFGKKYWRGTVEGDGFVIKTNPLLDFKALDKQTIGNQQGAPGNEEQTSILWLKNTSTTPKHFNIEVSVPLPMAVQSIAVDGMLNLTYVVYGPETSGYLTCSDFMDAPGDGLVQMVSDGIHTNVINCPFSIGSTLNGGSGFTTSSTFAVLGTPAIGPSTGVVQSGTRKDSISIKFNVKIDPSDKFFVNGASFILFGTPICLGDQNMDDKVDGSDVVELLSRWGLSPAHPLHDPSANGVVDVNDLAASLGHYGDCTVDSN